MSKKSKAIVIGVGSPCPKCGAKTQTRQGKNHGKSFYFVKMKKAYLPHLHYSVFLKEKNKAKEKAKIMLDSGCVAVTENRDRYSSVIYMDLPLKKKDLPTLGHELIHVLQNICDLRHIDFVSEQENIAYMFQYLFCEFTGYELY